MLNLEERQSEAIVSLPFSLAKFPPVNARQQSRSVNVGLTRPDLGIVFIGSLV